MTEFLHFGDHRTQAALLSTGRMRHVAGKWPKQAVHLSAEELFLLQEVIKVRTDGHHLHAVPSALCDGSCSDLAEPRVRLNLSTLAAI
jgi:hypothetical protein